MATKEKIKVFLKKILFFKFKKMITLENFIKKYNWKSVDVDRKYWHQCVDLIKQYTIDCFWLSIWSFWWSAMTGWKNSVNTFSKTKFEKIIDLSKLLPWDIVFTVWSSENDYWHVMIMTKKLWNWKIEVLEQNMWDWNWKGSDDFVKISTYNLNSKILWAYRYKENRIFTDVSEDHPFFKSIKWAKDNWIAHWYSDGRLWADEVLTVWRFLAFLENYDKNKN